MPKVTMDYYGFTGEGPNLKEAKANACEKLREAMTGTYSPAIIRYRGWVCVVGRDPTGGWAYRIFSPENTKIMETGLMSWSAQDRDGTIISAVRHLADLIRPVGEPCDTVYDLWECAVLSSRDRDRAYENWRDDCKRSDVFQKRYRYAIGLLGLNENDAYNWAHMNPGCRELWAGTEDICADAGRAA
jgi:hypothetical protein